MPRVGKNGTLTSWVGTVILMLPKNLESSDFLDASEVAEVAHFTYKG